MSSVVWCSGWLLQFTHARFLYCYHSAFYNYWRKYLIFWRLKKSFWTENHLLYLATLNRKHNIMHKLTQPINSIRKPASSISVIYTFHTKTVFKFKSFKTLKKFGPKPGSHMHRHTPNCSYKIPFFPAGGGRPAEEGRRWSCVRFVWTERPAAASLLGCWVKPPVRALCRDWIQIRCLREAELHDNEGFLRDRGHVDPSLTAVAGVYTAAGKTERLPLLWAADPWGLYPAITGASFFYFFPALTF